MSENRKLKVQPPPDGYVWAQDYEGPDGRIVLGIASRLGITYSTYRKWRMRDEGPPTRIIGKKVAARIDWIDAYLAQQDRKALAELGAAAAALAYDMRPAESRAA
ncbi:hypothetical protein ACWDXD_33750 [Streptomyces sp. NPDC003314]